MNLFINELLKDTETESLYRVLWLDESNFVAYLIELEDEKALPFKRSVSDILEDLVIDNLIKVKSDPYLSINQLILDEKHQQLRDQAWAVIKEMVQDEPAIFEKKPRSIHINAAKEKFNVSYPAIRKYLRKYWQRGKTINALLPDYKNSGAKGIEREAGERKRGRPRKHHTVGINVDEATKKVFRVALEKYYLTSKQNSMPDAYHMMIKEFYAKDYYYDENGIKQVVIDDEDNLPTITQFRYWYNKEYTVKESTIARKGRRKYEKDFREVLNHSLSEVNGPGSRFQIDATVGDIYLKSQYNDDWIIGRPVIYLVIDVFSRMVVGMYVGLEGPSWMGAMMALANTVTDKQRFCQEYDIAIHKEDWPCDSLPEILLADRGEIEGIQVERLITAFNLHVENAAPYRADWKGIVEKHFDVIQKKVKPFLPGYIQKDFQERGAHDYRLDAKLTLKQLTQILIKEVLKHNREKFLETYIRDEDMIRDDVNPTPLELWNWGIKNRSGKLRYTSEEAVKLHLLPQENALVTFKGIRFKNIYYSCNRAIKEAWLPTAKQKGSWKVKIAYDPRNMSHVYLFDFDTNKHLDCYLLPTSERYQNKSLDEILHLQSYERQMKKDVNHKLIQTAVDHISDTEAIVKQAEEDSRNNNSQSKSAKVKMIRENRKEEREQIRKKEVFDLNENKQKNQKGEIVSLHSKNEKDVYARPSLKEILKRKEQEHE